jgi:Rrf2 family protein
MKLITKNTDYAMRALCYIARQRHAEKAVTVGELSRKLKIPLPFLRKILQMLHRKRILKAYKGNKGGFLLARPAEKIYLIELIEIFQGPIELSQCFIRKRLCPDRATCLLRKKIAQMEKYLIGELKAITIKSLL